MNEQMKSFIDQLNRDEALQKKFMEASKAFNGDRNSREAFDAVLQPLAREAGCSFTWEDLQALVAEKSRDDAVSDDELKQAAGGVKEDRGYSLAACALWGVGLVFSHGKEFCCIIGQALALEACWSDGYGL